MAREPQIQHAAAREGGGAGTGDPALMREMRLQRNLKILVGGLAVLIFAGLGAVAWKMTQLAKERRSGPAGTPVSAAASNSGTSAFALELPKGARIVSTSISENRLAVHYESPAGAGIAILDLETGRRIADITPQEALPRN